MGIPSLLLIVRATVTWTNLNRFRRVCLVRDKEKSQVDEDRLVYIIYASKSTCVVVEVTLVVDVVVLFHWSAWRSNAECAPRGHVVPRDDRLRSHFYSIKQQCNNKKHRRFSEILGVWINEYIERVNRVDATNQDYVQACRRFCVCHLRVRRSNRTGSCFGAMVTSSTRSNS
jgi:hypothetical protein